MITNFKQKLKNSISGKVYQARSKRQACCRNTKKSEKKVLRN